MVLEDFNQYIDEMTTFTNTSGNNQYDIALFRIWIKFEKYLIHYFINYSIGNVSQTGYSPRRKIAFIDEQHFNIFMKSSANKYIDYFKKIKELSKHIFIDDPFTIINETSQFSNVCHEVKLIRDYIAHESGESKQKLIKSLFNNEDNRFLEPEIYLNRIKRGTDKSYYSYYTESLKEILNYIDNPTYSN